MSSRPTRRHAARHPKANPRRWIESEAALELWAEYAASGDTRLRDRLALTYAPLVKFIVYRKLGELPPTCEIDDLVSAGLEALLRAIDRYDPDKGATLEQFAWTRIHGAVIDEMRRGDWAPRSLRRWERDMRRASSEFHAIHGRAPTSVELADALAMTMRELHDRQRDLQASEMTSLNTPVLGSDGALSDRLDLLPGDTGSPFEASASREAKLHFRRAFAQLTRREREVAVLLYVKNLTLREIGGVLGVSESRVCQIHGELKRSLRRSLDEHAELMAVVA